MRKYKSIESASIGKEGYEESTKRKSKEAKTKVGRQGKGEDKKIV